VTSRLFSLIGALLVTFAISGRASAQGVGMSPPQIPTLPSSQQPPSPEEEARKKMEKDMAKKANEERQAALKRDTEKLLKLSTELKAYVDRSNENMLSVDVIRKAEEIEKLAHSVKEKMKGN
jgi:nitric oxide reductase activation protein